MKARILIFLVLISFTVEAQEEATVRLSLSYKMENQEAFLTAKARTRVGRRYENIHGLGILFYTVIDGDKKLLGDSNTNHSGEATMSIGDISTLEYDSMGMWHFVASVENKDGFRDVDEEISITPIKIDFKVEISEDSVASVRVQSRKSMDNGPVSEAEVRLYVSRYFAPHWLSEIEFTDDNGEFEFSLEEMLPGDLDGLVTLGIRLEGDDTGAVFHEEKVNYGIPYEPDTSFDERSMWAPANKTPLWLLVFPNLIILGVWGTLIYLVYYLYLISRSKQ